MLRPITGLWRVVSQVDGVARLNDEGWEGLLSLLRWCANRGGKLKPVRVNELKSRAVGGGISEDDPVLQSYRSLHHLLHADELDAKIPNELAESVCLLVRAGQLRNYPQLSMASLDLLPLLIEKRINALESMPNSDTIAAGFWTDCWRRCVEGMAAAAELSSDSGVRQHALSMLTDLFLDKRGNLIPSEHLCAILSDVCIPLAGRCILKLRAGERLVATADDVMIQYELCIGLIFKPMRHHLQVLTVGSGLLGRVWKSMLAVLDGLLCPSDGDAKPVIPLSLQSTMDNLASEHLRNAVIALCSSGFLEPDGVSKPGDMTTWTWESIQRMGIPDSVIQEWKSSGFQSS